MEKIIACCGLNCAICDARIATVTNNEELRAQTAEKWRTQFKVEGMSAEMINCTGCMEEGAKLGHCAECEIRACAVLNGFRTCAECDKMESCALIGNFHKYVPDALENLKSLN